MTTATLSSLIREPADPTKLTMRVADETGDTKHIWDPEIPAEVEGARALFNSLTRDKKYTAYRVNEDGKTGKVMRTFDPEAGLVIFMPAMQGG